MSQGVRVALGTDSLASVAWAPKEQVELDMLAEMRCFASAHPGIAPREILKMATLHGAEAVSRGRCLGRLGQGSRADLVVLALKPGAAELEEAVLAHAGEVRGVMIDGVWVKEPGGVPV
jgi:cytosine/adenosine deaminase-related metal-dependent hydrolase